MTTLHKITLLEAPRRRSMLETSYDIQLNGERFGELCYNMRGYIGYRLTASNGETVIGRLVLDHQLMHVYDALGVTAHVQWTPETLLRSLNAQHARIKLPGGITLQKVYVMNRPRVEMTGVQANDLPHYKALGCFTEINLWKTRLFIPIDDLLVLGRVLNNHTSMQEAV